MTEYKKYILFAFDDHYPRGGLGDILDSFDDLDDAKAAMINYDNFEIVDRDTWQNIEI